MLRANVMRSRLWPSVEPRRARLLTLLCLVGDRGASGQTGSGGFRRGPALATGELLDLASNTPASSKDHRHDREGDRGVEDPARDIGHVMLAEINDSDPHHHRPD